jgi:hypothetical protein
MRPGLVVPHAATEDQPTIGVGARTTLLVVPQAHTLALCPRDVRPERAQAWRHRGEACEHAVELALLDVRSGTSG